MYSDNKASVYHNILAVDGIFVRQFLRDAENQMRILNAFEDQHWPHRIDDPFTPAAPDGQSEDDG